MVPTEISQRLTRLLAILRSRTMAGTIEWSRADDIAPDAISTSVPSISVSIHSSDNDGLQPFVLNLYDQEGRLVTSVSSNSDDYPDEVGEQIAELWTVIHTSAGQIVTYLDRAIAELGDEPPF